MQWKCWRRVRISKRQRLEEMLRATANHSDATVDTRQVDSAPNEIEASTSRVPTTSRLHHVRVVETPTLRLHRGTKKASKRGNHKNLEVVPGGGVEPPRYQVPADFESAASASSAIPAREGSFGCRVSVAEPGSQSKNLVRPVCSAFQSSFYRPPPCFGSLLDSPASVSHRRSIECQRA